MGWLNSLTSSNAVMSVRSAISGAGGSLLSSAKSGFPGARRGIGSYLGMGDLRFAARGLKGAIGQGRRSFSAYRAGMENMGAARENMAMRMLGTAGGHMANWATGGGYTGLARAGRIGARAGLVGGIGAGAAWGVNRARR